MSRNVQGIILSCLGTHGDDDQRIQNLPARIRVFLALIWEMLPDVVMPENVVRQSVVEVETVTAGFLQMTLLFSKNVRGNGWFCVNADQLDVRLLF